MSVERTTGTRWYGRRRGRKLSPGRQALVETLLPEFRLTAPADGTIVRFADCFPDAPEDVWLEIGFGGGEHLAAQAGAHPGIGFIGCEPFVNGVASALSLVERDGLTNIRIFDDDARLILNALPDASIGRLFVLFADPWPKRRHEYRRLVSTNTLDQFARLMKNGAEFRFASDHMDYVRWTLEHVLRHLSFTWPVCCADEWRRPPTDWIETRYEAKAFRRGKTPVYLRFYRRPRPAAEVEKTLL